MLSLFSRIRTRSFYIGNKQNRHRSCHRDSGGVDDGKFLIRLLIKHGTIRRPRGFCKVLFALRGSELDFPSPFEKRNSLLLHLTDESP